MLKFAAMIIQEQSRKSVNSLIERTRVQLPELRKVTVIDLEKQPGVINPEKHHRNYSFLNRRPSLNVELCRSIVPMLARSKREQCLNITLLRPRSDDLGTVAATIINSFRANPNLGKLRDWQIKISVYDPDADNLSESLSKYAGQLPLVGYSEVGQDMDQLALQALNERREYLKVEAFAIAPEDNDVMNHILKEQPDLLFTNSCYDIHKARQLAEHLLGAECVIVDQNQVTSPVFHLKNDFLIQDRYTKHPLTDDYAVAIPAIFQRRWLERKRVQMVNEINALEAKKNRLEILYVSDNPDDQNEFNFRLNVSKWCQDQGLAIPSFASITSGNLDNDYGRKDASVKQIITRLNQGAFSMICLDAQGFLSVGKDRVLHENFAEYISMEFIRAEQFAKIIVLSNEEEEVRDRKGQKRFDLVRPCTDQSSGDSLETQDIYHYLAEVCREKGFVEGVPAERQNNTELLHGLSLFRYSDLPELDELALHFLLELSKIKEDYLTPFLSSEGSIGSVSLDDFDSGKYEKFIANPPFMDIQYPLKAAKAFNSFLSNVKNNLLDILSVSVADEYPGYFLFTSLESLGKGKEGSGRKDGYLKIILQAVAELKILNELPFKDLHRFMDVKVRECGGEWPDRYTMLSDNIVCRNIRYTDELRDLKYTELSSFNTEDKQRLAESFNELVDTVDHLMTFEFLPVIQGLLERKDNQL